MQSSKDEEVATWILNLKKIDVYRNYGCMTFGVNKRRENQNKIWYFKKDNKTFWISVCLPDHTSFTVSLSLSVVPKSNGFTIQEGLPHAACECWCSYCIRFLKKKKITMRKKTDRLLMLLCTNTETGRYLDSAEYSSYKQVGVLVDVQNSEGRRRVGTGRGRHHTSHGAFQRIYWYGAIQPIAGDREKEGVGLMLFSRLFCISW